MWEPTIRAVETCSHPSNCGIIRDIYSLGCTLYYLLAARVPFPVESSVLKLSSHMLVEPKPLSALRDDVPQALADVLEKMMAKDPADRFQSAAELAEALAPFAGSQKATRPRVGESRIIRKPEAPRSPSRRKRKSLIALVAIVAAFMLAAVLVYQFRPSEHSNNVPGLAAEDDVFVLFALPPDGLWYNDFGPVYDTLKQHGVRVKVASTRPAIAAAPGSGGDGQAIKVDILIEDVIVSHLQ